MPSTQYCIATQHLRTSFPPYCTELSVATYHAGRKRNGQSVYRSVLYRGIPPSALRFDAPTDWCGVEETSRFDTRKGKKRSAATCTGYPSSAPPLFAVHCSLSFFPLTIHSIMSCYPEVSLYIIPCISVRSFPFSSQPRASDGASRTLHAYNDEYFSYLAPKPYD
jgi:hypothetical protein